MFTYDLMQDYALLVVAGGSLLLGGISGLVGALALMRKQTILPETLSYASLPGIVIAFLITATYSHAILLAGATIACLVAAVQIVIASRRCEPNRNRSLNILPSVYFGVGIVLLSMIQHLPNSAQAGIETFLFGEVATMLIQDVQVIGIVALVIVIIITLFWKELIAVSFDPVFAESSGLPVSKLNILLMILIVSTVLIGLQTVGVVLMGAMFIMPAAAARQWTNTVSLIAIISMLFGALACAMGGLISSVLPKLSTGPAIIIIMTIIVLASFIFAPARGMLWSHLKKIDEQNSLAPEVILKILYMLSLQHEEQNTNGHPIDLLNSFFPLKKNMDLTLLELKAQRLITSTRQNHWAISELGIAHIKQLSEAVKR